MTHHAAAVLTVNLLRARDAAIRFAEERGQGTVEYVGLILLVAGVLAGVVIWAMAHKGDKEQIGSKITGALTKAIDHTTTAAPTS